MKRATLTATSSLALPLDSYIYRILPFHRNAQIAAISSDDSLRLIDSSTLKEISNGIIPNVHGGVVCLDATADDTSCLLTAGRDGSVRYWDLRLGYSTLEFRDSMPVLTSHDQAAFSTRYSHIFQIAKLHICRYAVATQAPSLAPNWINPKLP